MGQLTRILLYNVLFVLVAAPAVAQNVPSSDGALATGAGARLPSACRPGAWDLGGAAQNVSEEAAWNYDWTVPGGVAQPVTIQVPVQTDYAGPTATDVELVVTVGDTGGGVDQQSDSAQIIQ